jgi:hypothetical protein
MVDLVGIEPTTSSMPWKRAPSCATGPILNFNCLTNLRFQLSKTGSTERSMLQIVIN